MRRLVCALVALLFWTSATLAQQAGGPVSLFADEIRYDSGPGVLVASGNVEAYYGDARLIADEIRYDRANASISASGNIILDSGGDTVILASLAELSPDFQTGLIEGARLILDRQFQVAAVQGQRSQGRFNTLHKTVATSCRVCDRDEVPVWQIRARRVVHDEEKRRIYFEGAWIDLFGVPIGYLPKLRVPEPGVRRADGFLIPSFTNSDIYGLGVKIPYFLTFGDHADLTVTPFISSEGAFLIEGDYRRRSRRGIWSLGGALAIADEVTGKDGRGFLKGNGSFALPSEMRADFGLYVASDKDFLGQFSYDDADRLNNFASVSRYRSNSYFDLRAEAYQTLRENEDQGTIPLVLPKAEVRRVWYDGPVPGKLVLGASLLGLNRTSGRDALRLGANASWRGDTILDNGMQIAGIADFHAELYSVGDDPAFSDDPHLARATPTIGAELRWPLVRQSRKTTHIIEPVAQVFYTDVFGSAVVPNEDSLLPEFDETNLFAINRFPGVDDSETGLRLNYGISYTRYQASGWSLGLTFGQVLRDTTEDGFSDGTGLSTRLSDYVAAVSWDFPPNYHLIGRALFDTQLDFKRGELEAGYRQRGLDIDVAYTFLADDLTNPILGPIREREQLVVGSRYRYRPNWEVAGSWRYDLSNSRSISGKASITYGNECAEAELGISRRLTSSSNLPRGTEISFGLRLSGLGGSGKRDWPAKQCGG